MYEVIDISLATTDRLVRYALETPETIKGTGLKTFEHAWVINSHPWSRETKALDVGGAYSWLPCHLQKQFGCETWVADDFGMNSGDDFWQRHRDPKEHIAAHPEVKYVLERLGDTGSSSLPENYFDVVYSVSTLEHVPPAVTTAVWKHMDRLLKPGGVMLHGIDIPFPSNGGFRRIGLSIGLDKARFVLPRSLREKYVRATPLGYASMVCQTLGIPGSVLRGRNLGIWRMILDPEVMTESYEHLISRVKKDNPTHHYRRIGSLLIHLRKK